MIQKNNEKNIENADKKIPSTSELVKETDHNTKILEIENKLPSVTGLVTTTALENRD